jgi:hypothetical protein
VSRASFRIASATPGRRSLEPAWRGQCDFVKVEAVPKLFGRF